MNLTLFNFEGSIYEKYKDTSTMNLENCTMYKEKLNALRHKDRENQKGISNLCRRVYNFAKNNKMSSLLDKE